MSSNIVAPVVVNPLIASKNASVYGTLQHRLYGNAPNIETITHENTVIHIPSRIPPVFMEHLRVVKSISIPHAEPVIIESAKGILSTVPS